MTISPAQWGINLSKAWGVDRLPIDVEQVAYEFSKQIEPNEPIIHIKAFPDKKFEGALFKQRKGWVILYNPTVSQGRINFTIAHEFGHYLLHRQGSEAFNCTEENVAGGYDQREDFRKIEREADKFATYLLMPADDLREQIGNGDVSVELLSQCASRYGVSFLAIALRWIEITEKKALVVVSTDGFVLWSVSSKSARRSRLYKKPGDELPAQSLASLRQERGNSSIANTDEQFFDSGVWFRNAGAKELLLSADNYGMQISILLLEHNDTPSLEDEEEPYDSFDKFMGLQSPHTT